MSNIYVKLFLITAIYSGGGDVVLIFAYLHLWWPSCSAERNNFGNFGMGHNEEHLR